MTYAEFTTACVAAAAALSLAACSSMNSGREPTTAAQAEVANANNQNANQSATPGHAGTAPNGGNSNPGTSGSVSAAPGQPR